MREKVLISSICLVVWIALAECGDEYHQFSRKRPSAARSGQRKVKESANRLSQDGGTHWNLIAKRELQQALNKIQNNNVAKNVILFVGDGMAPTTVTAARTLKGQIFGRTGEEEQLAFEQFPSIGISKPYGADQQVPDSAQTATAMMCGEKTNIGVLGLGDTAVPGYCPSTFTAKKLKCITRMANEEGKSVGLVTTSRITHATPAAGYAYSPYRNWEGDSEGIDSPCKDIAKQLVMENDYLQVILGGGRRYFLPNTTADPVHGTDYANDQRQDGLDLTKLWLAKQEAKGKKVKYVWHKEDFYNVEPECTDYLLGLFHGSHMSFSLDNDKGPDGEPTLAEMTEKAIQILSRNKQGYFLMVEGARIDHAEHANWAKRALFETLAFEEAVVQAKKMTSSDDTLIVVTADHGHSIKMGGYPTRGNDILGLSDQPSLAGDNKPYTTLSFSTGSGYQFGNRADLTNVDINDNDYRQASAVPMYSSTHGGEDVNIYATGPMAHLFEGMHEQHYIAHAMMYASCLGPDKRHCRQSKRYMKKRMRKSRKH